MSVSVTGLRWTPAGSGESETELEISAKSHVGLVRTVNEDSCLAEPPIFLVADGMGGHSAGDAASALVVDAFRLLVGRDAVTVEDLDACIRTSRTHVDALAVEGSGAPGSTVVAAAYVVNGGIGYWLLANVGDSRAYLWTSSGMDQISKDHSLVQEMLDAGEIDDEQARLHPDRHVITRAIGALEDSPADFSLVPASPGSRLLLCSDGLSSELSDSSISSILADAPSTELAATRLVEAAVSAGGHDNVTVVVVDVAGRDSEIRADTLGDAISTRRDEDTVRLARGVSGR